MKHEFRICAVAFGVVVSTLFGETTSSANTSSPASVFLEEAIRTTQQAGASVSRKKYTDPNTGRPQVRIVTQMKIGDSDSQVFRLEIKPDDRGSSGASRLVIIQNQEGTWMIFPNNEAAIRLDFIQSIFNAAQTKIAGTDWGTLLKNSGKTSFLEMESNDDGARKTIKVQIGENKELIQSFMAAMSINDLLGSGTNLNEINYSTVEFVVDTNSNIILGQRITDQQGKILVDSVFDEVLPINADDVDKQLFVVPSHYTIYPAKNASDLPSLIRRIIGKR